MKLSLPATGASFMPCTVTVTVAIALPPWPSLRVYWKLVLRLWPSPSWLNSPLGLKIRLPASSKEKMPPLSPACTTAVPVVTVPPSMSLSLVVICPSMTASSS